MADDDMDIEEYDLLDKPLLRSMFPDLSIIKKEISDFDVAVPTNDITSKLESEDRKGHQSLTKLIMADDDMDIEEHDLLDKPLLRSMFPDLSVIKKEISDYDVAVPTNDIASKLSKSEDRKGHTTKVTILKDFKREDQNVKQYYNVKKLQNIDRLKMISKINNKSVNKASSSIISKYESNKLLNIKRNDVDTKSSSVRLSKTLNKKTVSKAKGRIKNLLDISSCKNHDANIISISSTSQNSCTEKISIKQRKKCEKRKSDKIILGSKLNVNIEAYNNTSILYNVKVSLQNIGSLLNKSCRYCKVCMTLFPSNKALTHHNNAMHPQTDRIISVESQQNKNSSVIGNRYKSSLNALIKHKTNAHLQKTKTRKKDEKLLNLSTDDTVNKEKHTFKCTHCNQHFSSQQLLIDHMYNVLQSKNKNVSDSTDKIEDNGLKKGKLTLPRNYYRCTFCSYYFKTCNILLNHVKNKHKKTIKKKLEKIAFNPTCNLCNKNYANVLSFNTHVWKFHQKATIAHKGKLKFCEEQKREFIESISLNKDNLQAISSDVDIKYHKIPEESPPIINEQQKCLKNKRFILKSALFKCVKCDVCFLSGSKAADHIRHMDELINWKCLKCLRIFKKGDEMLHTYQHLFSETFYVFEIRTTALLSLLYKCPNCITYFFENDLYSHYFYCETRPSHSAYCKICDILIDSKIQEIHDKHHNIIGKELTNIYVESDLIEYNDEGKPEIEEEKEEEKKSTDTVDLKEDIEIEQKVEIEVDSKMHSVEQKKQMLSFRYCNKCDSFISKMHKLYNHTKAPCSNLVNFVCKYCGLKISNKLINRHRKMHQRMPGLTLKQFKFYDLKGRKIGRPPIPKYPNCNKCLKHFITKTAIISHKCNDMSYLTCPICDIKFSDLAFSLHMAFHNYSSKNDDPKDSTLALSNLQSKSDKKLDLNQTTNLVKSNKTDDHLLVYICKSCKIAVDIYDKVIEHCQDHIGNEPNERITKACDTCNIIIDLECFDNHKMLHANNYNKRFTILNFDVFYSTSDINIWLDHLFGSLPTEEIDKILGESIYKTERRIKLKIIQNGLPHLTFYKCAKCNTFIDPSLLYEHCQVNTFCQTSKIVCSSCGISLVSEKFRTKHEKIHDTENVTSKSYRIVLFNCEEDKSINYALSLPNQYILFECRNCSGVVDKRFYNNHKCNFSDLTKCSRCGLLLYSNEYMAHVLKHKEFCSFIENNMKVILIGQPKDDFITKGQIMSSFSGIKLDYLVYQCANCLVCLKEKKLSLIHKCLLSSSVRKCSDCELYFEVHQLVNHRILHECDAYFVKENITVIQFGFSCSKVSDEEDIIVIEHEDDFRNKDKNIAIDCIDNLPKPTEANEEVVNVNNLYQCSCGFHFLNQSSALSHYKTCSNNPRSAKQICSKCGLYFKPGVLFEHLLAHHGSKSIQKFNIIRICENLLSNSKD